MAKGRKTTIKNRILRLSILSIVSVVTVLMGVISVLLYRVFNENYRNEAQSLASAYSLMIQTDIENLRFDLDTMASDLVVLNKAIPIQSRQVRLDAAAATSRFKDFSVADEDGSVLNGSNIADREYFQHALERGEYCISAPVARRTDNSIVMMAAAPAILFKEHYYVICGAVDGLYFSRGLDTIDMGEGSNIVVIDQYGQIVASSDTSQVLNLVNYAKSDDPELRTFAAEMISQEEGFWSYQRNGVQYLAAYQSIPETDGWTIAVSANYSDIVVRIVRDILLCLAVCAMLTLIGVVVSLKVAEKVSRPVIRNTARLKLLAEGDVKTPFENNAPNDETYVLSQSVVNTVSTMRRYITDIHNMLGAMANGDLTVRSEVDYHGDFVQIGEALTRISDALNEEFSHIQASVDQLRAGAGQVAQGAQLLSTNSAEEAQAVAEISSTIGELNQQADATAEISARAAQLTRNTNDNVKAGGARMQELLEAVENIKEKSSAIGDIIKAIGDIAFQTNILALNASIEAARAGVAGKGFAVVANEVGALANKSQEAAQSTESLIGDSIAAVETGMKIARSASVEMGSIVGDIAKVATEIERINSAAKEQKDAINLIAENISRIEANMQATTSTAAESAASSEELSTLSSSIAEMVNRYKTRGS